MFAVWSFLVLILGAVCVFIGVRLTRKHLTTYGKTREIPVSTGMFGLVGLVLLCLGVVGLSIAAVTS